MNILDFYQALLSENDDGNNARKVLIQTHWFSVNADFDPKSGEALPQSLTHFLKRITNPSSGPLESVDTLMIRIAFQLISRRLCFQE